MNEKTNKTTNENALSGYLKVKALNNDVRGKRRVYFTCHPDDFDKYFEKVTDDILKCANCAIFYTENMAEPLPEVYREADLGQMNLFVIPVTYNLLTKPNRAMDSDFAFADSKQGSIPVLPLVMEDNLDEFFKARFGARQYLMPFASDRTAISYEKKLSRYLASVLLDDETVERVRKAFDAYVFLSYRKKDRQFANELMHFIHKNPLYRDVAIWYDEFLTPGESFEKNIGAALENCNLFALLVTPNLINEKNYVRDVEYPMAKNAGKPVIPAEMQKTDRKELEKQYDNLPDCVDAYNDDDLSKSISEALKKISLKANENDPEHNFLIGMAYFSGIDVEINGEYAVELMTSAAEARLPEAMITLYAIYQSGERMKIDFDKSLYWAEKLYAYYSEKEGKTSENALNWLNNVVFAQLSKGDFANAAPLAEKAYALNVETSGEKSAGSISALSNLISVNNSLANTSVALELSEKLYRIQCETEGKESPVTQMTLTNMAQQYAISGNIRKGLEYAEIGYRAQLEAYGEKSAQTIYALNALSILYSMSGDVEQAAKTSERAYELCRELLGEDNATTLSFSMNLAHSYQILGKAEEALALFEKVCRYDVENYGIEHPATVIAIGNLGQSYALSGKKAHAFNCSYKVYRLNCRIYGKKHPGTILSLNNFGYSFLNLGAPLNALDYFNEAYDLSKINLGEAHPTTVLILNNLSQTYSILGNMQKSLDLSLEAYRLQCSITDERHPTSIVALKNIADTYSQLEDAENAIKCAEKAYKLQVEVFGENHRDSLIYLFSVLTAYSVAEDYEKMAELVEKGYELSMKLKEKPQDIALGMMRQLQEILEDIDEEKAEKLGEKIDEFGGLPFTDDDDYDYDEDDFDLDSDDDDESKEEYADDDGFGSDDDYDENDEKNEESDDWSYLSGEENGSFVSVLFPKNEMFESGITDALLTDVLYGKIDKMPFSDEKIPADEDELQLLELKIKERIMLFDEAHLMGKSTENLLNLYVLKTKTAGETDEDAISALNAAGENFSYMGDEKKELLTNIRLYRLICKVHGESSREAQNALFQLLISYNDQTRDFIYDICNEVYRAKYPLSEDVATLLSLFFDEGNETEKSFSIFKRASADGSSDHDEE